LPWGIKQKKTMRDKQFTGYKQVVYLTADFVRYVADVRPNRPVEGYLRARKITDAQDIAAVCKIARKLGHDVCMRQGRWYENGVQIVVL